MYLDWFLILLRAKVLAPGSYTLNPPHSVMEMIAWEQPCGPSPEQGRAESIPLPCPHSACVPGKFSGNDGLAR